MRYSICQSCPHRKKGWFRWFCEKCGCTINGRANRFNKLAHANQECPIGKWTTIE